MLSSFLIAKKSINTPWHFIFKGNNLYNFSVYISMLSFCILLYYKLYRMYVVLKSSSVHIKVAWQSFQQEHYMYSLLTTKFLEIGREAVRKYIKCPPTKGSILLSREKSTSNSKGELCHPKFILCRIKSNWVTTPHGLSVAVRKNTMFLWYNKLVLCIVQ